MTYRYVWSDGFVKYDGYRWGTSRGLKIDGDVQVQHSGVWYGNDPQQRMNNAMYHGVYRSGAQVVLAYNIRDMEVFDSPWAFSEDGIDVWTRQLQYSGAKDNSRFLVLDSFPSDTRHT